MISIKLIAPTEVWEGTLVEAPDLVRHGSKYYLFYSANDYASTKYGVGYAVADKVEGPYIKNLSNPILATDLKVGVVGPGGEDVVVGPDGNTWILYHAWAAGGYRNLYLDRLVWEGDKAVVKGPTRSPQPAP